MLRIVQACAGKPLRARHRASSQYSLVRARRPDVEVLPERPPETFQILDRPLPQRRIGIEAPSAFGEPAHIVCQVCIRNPRGARRPEQVALIHFVHAATTPISTISAGRRMKNSTTAPTAHHAARK